VQIVNLSRHINLFNGDNNQQAKGDEMEKPKVAAVWLIFLLVLGGCSMENKEIIAAKTECEQGGMDYGMTINTLTGSVYSITCMPKRN
jgi:hypothetical protein